ncbi:hypothetical protein [Paenarthrobacter aurescens]|nr:hypothetical protein [Paenarthrobacter aurescens]MCT9868612.1 hypothetical protein [Paenarthrobacter aurescens]
MSKASLIVRISAAAAGTAVLAGVAGAARLVSHRPPVHGFAAHGNGD